MVMDTKFSSSFIPKTSYEEANTNSPSFGIFSAVAILLFIISIVSSGGFFVYKMMLKGDTENLKSQLESAIAEVDTNSINDIILFEKRITSIKDILRNHVVASSYFDMLEKTTVSKIQFTDLKYNFVPGENLKVEMGGRASSFGTIALQEDAFLKDPNTVSVTFTSMRADKKTGVVSFAFKGEFKSDLIKFKLPEGFSLPDETSSNAESDLGGAIEDLGNLPNISDL